VNRSRRRPLAQSEDGGVVPAVREIRLERVTESPALTGVRLELPGGLGADIVPERIPDVYLGEPVTVALRAIW